MNLDKYTGVIRMVVAKNAGKPPEEITQEILRSVEIATALMGEVSIETPSKPAQLIALPASTAKSQPIDFKKATLISAAPPVANIEESETPDDNIDYWESKPGKGDGCNRLQAKLQSVLPKSITIQVPGIDEPLTLVCGIGSPGIQFVHVNYGIPGGELGPRYTLMTSQKDIDPDVIMADIMQQAAAIYSSQKRKIEPHNTAVVQSPTNQTLQDMMNRDRLQQLPNDGVSGEDAMKASEDARAWAQNRPAQWR